MKLNKAHIDTCIEGHSWPCPYCGVGTETLTPVRNDVFRCYSCEGSWEDIYRGSRLVEIRQVNETE